MATGTPTPNLGLFKPKVGERNYGAAVNANFDILDRYVSSSMVDVRAYGAKGTGLVDDAPAFRLAAASGKRLILVPYGVYLFSTYDPTIIATDEYACVAIPTGVEFVTSVGTILRMSTSIGAAGRVSFFGTRADTEGQHVENAVFDFNGIVSDGSLTSYNIVRAYGDEMTVRNCKANNCPGNNTIVIAGEGAIVENNELSNGGQNCTGNTLSPDHSFIYTSGAGGVYRNNRIYNTASAVSNCGGLELHQGGENEVSGNTFINLYPAIYTGVGDGDYISNDIHHNIFRTNTSGAIYISDNHSSLNISNNLFDNNTTTILAPRNAITGAATAVIKGLHVTNNTFLTSGSISLPGIIGGDISGNIFQGQSIAIQLQSSNKPIKNVNIHDNLLHFTSNPTGPIAAIVVGDMATTATFDNVFIDHNTVSCDGVYGNVYGCYFGQTDNTLTNVIFERNKLCGVSEDQEYTGVGAGGLADATIIIDT
jgi:hypothetical protein